MAIIKSELPFFLSYQCKPNVCITSNKNNNLFGQDYSYERTICMLTRNHPTRRKKKMILWVRNRIENDFKKMKQYYGNENYIQLFIEKR